MATAIEAITTLLTLSGLVYLLMALWGARDFVHHWQRRSLDIGHTPDVTILKPVKGIDPRMYAGLVSHCQQQYTGNFEIIFGVSSLDDPAAAEINRLRAEFPAIAIRLVECRERLGTSGKVSNLVQMLREARYEHVIINDSDIHVTPHYLTRVMACFADPNVGMVTAPYIGRTADNGPGLTLWSRLQGLGISPDFFAGGLTARQL